MAWKQQVLVLAAVTATSPDLLEALRQRASDGSVAFTVIVPAPAGTGGHEEGSHQAQESVAMLREAGLEVDGRVGDCDPMVAVVENWDPRKYDEVIVSTLPTSVSKWLHADLPQRIEKHTGALVTHVVARPSKPEPQPIHLEKHDDGLGLIQPLSVLSWGGRHGEHETR